MLLNKGHCPLTPVFLVNDQLLRFLTVLGEVDGEYIMESVSGKSSSWAHFKQLLGIAIFA